MTEILESPLAADEKTAAPYRWRWLAFSAVLASSVMDLLDSTVINTAAPAIRASLGGSYATLQWMAAGYTMALAVMLLIGGRLGDMFGRKRMLLVGVAGFTVASVACATAASPTMLIVSRVLQGTFGAVMLPQGFGLIRDLFPPEEMKKAWTAFGPVMGLSAVLGPIIGGTLIHADLFGTGWRMIFLVNVPIGAFALTVAARFLPATPPAVRSARLDLPGIALAASGTFMLIFPLVQGRELGWPTWIKALLACSLPVLTLFAAYQVRRKRTGATPLIEPGVFTRRSYTSGVLFAIAFTGAMGGTLLTLGIFMQVGLGYSPLRASLTTAPWAFGAMVGSAASGMLMVKLGRTLLHIGLVGMGAGLAVLYAVFEYAGPGVTSVDFLVPLLIGGVGMGMIFVPLFDIILGEVTDHEVGSASSTLQAVQQLGMSLGVAVIGTVFFGLLGAQAHHNFDSAAAPRLRAALTRAGVPAPAQAPIVAGVRTCVHDREAEKDPDTVPASCRATGGSASPAVVRAVTTAGLDTHRRDALDAAETTALLTIGLIVLAFGLGFLLPRQARGSEMA
ncbi:MFS transporter [Actinoallomurus purpureus]|uniref:MFS transporter n=1 Tax=Actinoallomurus purpureus TaxID=478114 RepID=UPI0020936530|nr:MFS transporter [Actinoallomurus purpureus]MCO6005555.1 MFS transporter [Actinoallomurus purpureus]